MEAPRYSRDIVTVARHLFSRASLALSRKLFERSDQYYYTTLGTSSTMPISYRMPFRSPRSKYLHHIISFRSSRANVPRMTQDDTPRRTTFWLQKNMAGCSRTLYSVCACGLILCSPREKVLVAGAIKRVRQLECVLPVYTLEGTAGMWKLGSVRTTCNELPTVRTAPPAGGVVWRRGDTPA